MGQWCRCDDPPLACGYSRAAAAERPDLLQSLSSTRANVPAFTTGAGPRSGACSRAVGDHQGGPLNSSRRQKGSARAIFIETS